MRENLLKIATACLLAICISYASQGQNEVVKTTKQSEIPDTTSTFETKETKFILKIDTLRNVQKTRMEEKIIINAIKEEE